MKLSEITKKDVQNYLKSGNDDSVDLTLITSAAKSYVKGYTGLTFEEIDNYEDITIAFLCLCSDMYDNRQVSVQNDKENPIVTQILAMHSRNYL